MTVCVKAEFRVSESMREFQYNIFCVPSCELTTVSSINVLVYYVRVCDPACMKYRFGGINDVHGYIYRYMCVL